MAEGMWSLNEDGTWELQEPYATMLQEAKVAATTSWHQGLIGYLVPRSPYTAQQLTDELLRRNREHPDEVLDTFDSFVLEALGGDL